jgi:methyl-accepting chemotaxis protein
MNLQSVFETIGRKLAASYVILLMLIVVVGGSGIGSVIILRNTIQNDLDNGVPVSDLASQVDRLLALSLIVFVLALAVSVVLMWRGMHLIGRRLHHITDAVEHIASGDLSQRVLVGGEDELGALAQAFNAMTDYVQVMMEDRT